ncbi:hypothetical protein GCM10025886_02330 [Tetragenococcus halophilus subsp. flandriensis]|uniref:hypothetical protein n=1 Tax=Tetragenococcus halophilus TaxID=51669 RepID=UPI0023EA3639|nr:hypothetical protein [Tetragenococcus halophilus]GMA07082.1 hypothetical protein GCM10025886_02330 [Tetragenococcus halophilus subsp. flandriensis]
MNKVSHPIIYFVLFMSVSLIFGKLVADYAYNSQYRGFNGYWKPTDVLAEGSEFKIKNKKMYELTKDGKQISYNLRKDGTNYLVDKEDIPESSFMTEIITPKIENPSPSGDSEVIYITGEDEKYSYNLPMYKVSKNETGFKSDLFSLNTLKFIIIGFIGLIVYFKYKNVKN